MRKVRLLRWLCGWMVLLLFQFLVFLHNIPLAAGDSARRDQAGLGDSPIRLPRPLAGALWDAAPFALFPLRNVVLAAFRNWSGHWGDATGWRAVVRRGLFPFAFPPWSEVQDTAFHTARRRALRRNAFWFSGVNSLIWIGGVAAYLGAVKRFRKSGDAGFR